MQIIKYITLLTLLLASISLSGQAFGVRAGLNFGTFLGPLENESESFSSSGGFHFGVNYSHHVTDIFDIVFELGYTQYGTGYSYNGDSYFIIRETDNTTWELGNRNMELVISNGYISLPILANYQISDKIEVFGGAYANLLVSPTAGGKVKFLQSSPIDSGYYHIEFQQTLDYSYNSDEALAGVRLGNQQPIGVFIDGRTVFFDKSAGAYYQFAEKKASFINGLDAGLIGGFNYFLNKGFYAGVRVEYGLTDITEDSMDASISKLDSNNEFILRKDNDTHFGVNLSIGFRF